MAQKITVDCSDSIISKKTIEIVSNTPTQYSPANVIDNMETTILYVDSLKYKNKHIRQSFTSTVGDKKKSRKWSNTKLSKYV